MKTIMRGSFMKNARQYYQVLNEIRLLKKMTVTDMCEGVISERTFYRLLQADSTVKIDTFIKLTKKLQISPYEVISYATYVSKGDPGLSRFVFRVHTKHYDDVDAIYEQIKSAVIDNNQLKNYIDVYMLKYQLDRDWINLEYYNQEIESIYKNHYIVGEHNLYNYILKLEYLLTIYQNDFTVIESTISQMLEVEPKMSVAYYIMEMDKILNLMVKSDHLDKVIFKQALNLFETSLQQFANKFFHNNYFLYLAFDNFMNDQAYEVELNKHLLSIYRDKCGGPLQEAIKLVESKFNLSVEDFVLKQTRLALEKAPFKDN